MIEVSVTCRFASEYGAAAMTHRLGRGARLLTLMPQKIAEGREFAPVAAMVPAPRLGGWLASRTLSRRAGIGGPGGWIWAICTAARGIETDSRR